MCQFILNYERDNAYVDTQDTFYNKRHFPYTLVAYADSKCVTPSYHYQYIKRANPYRYNVFGLFNTYYSLALFILFSPSHKS